MFGGVADEVEIIDGKVHVPRIVPSPPDRLQKVVLPRCRISLRSGVRLGHTVAGRPIAWGDMCCVVMSPGCSLATVVLDACCRSETPSNSGALICPQKIDVFQNGVDDTGHHVTYLREEQKSAPCTCKCRAKEMPCTFRTVYVDAMAMRPSYRGWA